jgi:multiple antibiotic resistance protein
MKEFPLVFTVLFMLLGPIKLIASFARVTQDMDPGLKRSIAVRSSLIASALCAFIALAGDTVLVRYHISIDALRIAAALVLLISALQVIFPHPQPAAPASGAPATLQLAASPVAVPGIVPPAGVAAILIFTMLAPRYPGLMLAVAISLAVLMALDFLAMYFIDDVMKVPGLMLVLTVLGSVLIFVQACLAFEVFLRALRDLGAIRG